MTYGGSPDKALALLEEGTRLSAAGQLEEGNRLLEAAIELDPTLVPAYCNRALNHVLADELERAAALYGQAIQLSPGDPVPRAGLGAVAAEKGDDRVAALHLEAAIELGHPGGEVRANLAHVLDRSGQTERAIELWLEAHRLDPIDPGPVLALQDRVDVSIVEGGRPFSLGRFERYDLYRHLDERLRRGAADCCHDLTETVGWALSRGVATLPLLAHLRRLGVTCDCEVALTFAEAADGPFEQATATGRIRAVDREAMSRALIAAGAARVERFLPPSPDDEDDPESWATQFLAVGGDLVLPSQPAVGSRLYRLVDAARIRLGSGGWAGVVLESTTDLVAPSIWILEERRAVEIDLDLLAVEDGTGAVLEPDQLPPPVPSTFHVQTLAAPWLDPEDLAARTEERDLARSVSTYGVWTLIGNRVGSEEPQLLDLLVDLSADVPDGEQLALRWRREGRLRMAVIERRRVRAFDLRSVPRAADWHVRMSTEQAHFVRKRLSP